MFSQLPGYGRSDVGSGLNPTWSNVVLALHGDGTNGSTTIVDEKGHTPNGTYLGSVALDTGTKRFGSASIKMPNNGGLIYADSYNADFDFGSGDFCFRAWVYWDGTTANAHVIVDTRASGGTGHGLVWYIDTDSKMYVYGNATLLYAGGSTFPSNQWVHVAYTRQSGNHRMFQGGVLLTANNYTITFTDGCFAVGDVTHAYANSQATWAGYMDDVQIIKGEPLYTSSYTPPGLTFPDL